MLGVEPMFGKLLVRLVAVAAATALIGGGALWLARRLDRPRNVILLTIDTMRADHLSSYGYARSQTPNFDRIANGGVRFALAYCDTPWTTGSLSSTMTSTFGPRHGVKTQRNKLPEDATTLAEILHAHGYRTGAVVGSFATDSAYQLDQGFDLYDDDLDTPVFQVPGVPMEKVDMSTSGDTLDDAEVNRKIANDGYRTDTSVTRAAISWLMGHRGEPFFLWVHYFGPHERFVMDKGVNHRDRVIRDYDPDTRATDSEVGRLLDVLDQLGMAGETLVILHSDHGQELREHGIFGHGHNLYEESMRVPIVMRLPRRIRPGTVVEQMVRNVDIMPTVLDYLGIAIPAGLDGRSIRPLIRGEYLPEAPAYMELIDATPLLVEMIPTGDYFGSSTWHGMRMGRWKYMNVRLNPPCLRNPTSFAPFGFLDVNPLHPIGGTPIPAEICTKGLRENLFEGEGHDYVDERVTSNKGGQYPEVRKDLFSRVDAIQENRRKSEGFELDPEQERKLKSLGYLK